MAELTRFVGVRFSQEEFDFIMEKVKQKKMKSISAFIRDSVLENNGRPSKTMKKQMYNLRWEVNKIGVNINQATKRINSGFGSRQDIQIMIANQAELKILLEKYLEEMEKPWQ